MFLKRYDLLEKFLITYQTVYWEQTYTILLKLLIIIINNITMNQYYFCKNNHLECYIISKSDNNNNNNNKQNLKAQRNSIRLLNQILISINKYGQKKVNKTHTLENIASRTLSINIYKSFFRLHLNYRDMIYDIKHAILLLYNAAAA